ncbi:hypothetical protein F511_40088 [Dorcoceras hygrometricum]|uniref:Uncharacterized protein n=1 Tax=Dorcoceras hygrometricum TaxID=472368 RepID=A0A2Z7DDH7_9LAMI|nr:hypothetical protein F511_40088 [Dorcoceras hygrometricum]
MNPFSASSQTTSSTTSWFSGIVRGRSASNKMPVNSSVASSGDSVAGGSVPINKKRQFNGVMFKYGPKPIQVAFKTGDYKQQVIFIGGLTDGFLATEYDTRLVLYDHMHFMEHYGFDKFLLVAIRDLPHYLYLEPLAIALEKESWSLVQFLLSSSYSGYGTSSLKQDALELDQLISYLINKEDSEGVVLLGHSTGCQDIVYYLRTNAACSRAVRAAILQAPVSDREYRATLPETASMIDLASKMLSDGRGSQLMPQEANPDSPISAYRYHSLCSYNGDDDMFSSDFSEDQLKQRLGHMSNTPTLIMFSMGDEYVPDYVDKKALVDRQLCRAMGGAEKVEVEHGNHSLSNRIDEAVQGIMEFIRRDGPKGWEDPWS